MPESGAAVNAPALDMLDRAALRAWIVEAIHGHQQHEGTGVGAIRHHQIAAYLDHVHGTTRETLGLIGLELLSLRPLPEWDPEAADTLLLLLPIVLRAEPSLRARARTICSALVATTALDAVPALGRRVLQTLAALGHRAPPTFWDAAHRRFGPGTEIVVLTGIANFDADAVAEWVTAQGWSDTLEDALCSFVPWAIHVFGPRVVGGMLVQVIPTAPRARRRRLRELAASEGLSRYLLEPVAPQPANGHEWTAALDGWVTRFARTGDSSAGAALRAHVVTAVEFAGRGQLDAALVRLLAGWSRRTHRGDAYVEGLLIVATTYPSLDAFAAMASLVDALLRRGVKEEQSKPEAPVESLLRALDEMLPATAVASSVASVRLSRAWARYRRALISALDWPNLVPAALPQIVRHAAEEESAAAVLLAVEHQAVTVSDCLEVLRAELGSETARVVLTRAVELAIAHGLEAQGRPDRDMGVAEGASARTVARKLRTHCDAHRDDWHATDIALVRLQNASVSPHIDYWSIEREVPVRRGRESGRSRRARFEDADSQVAQAYSLVVDEP